MQDLINKISKVQHLVETRNVLQESIFEEIIYLLESNNSTEIISREMNIDINIVNEVSEYRVKNNYKIERFIPIREQVVNLNKELGFNDNHIDNILNIALNGKRYTTLELKEIIINIEYF